MAIPVIDAHVHVNRFDLLRPEARAALAANPTFPLMERFVRDPQAFLQHLNDEGTQAAWLINYCAPDVMGYGSEVNDWVAQYAETDPKRLIAVGGYEPRQDGNGREVIERLQSLGIRALKIHPVHQHLRPDGRRLRKALSTCEETNMPVIFHTGSSRFPGAANKFGDPTRVGHVCDTFPDLQVVLAHGGRPDHTKEALDVVARHKNAWLDLSSCPPHRLKDYFGDLEKLAPRLLWGSDWPGPGVPGMKANVDAFLQLGLSEKANRLILHDNAKRLIP